MNFWIGQGRKRALLIGINYTGSANALNGCINDVNNVKQFLISLYNFREVINSKNKGLIRSKID